ncbi:hypothetical protein [uncultured Oscillibacter sp.]|uniref:hypothetical protein n=1 Tax=uncultured Oscillibacter sp. TaxID=876091 RepID=UPI0025D867CE|nr:hypothetical protein [uncultured Oscillibacter sp.]
MKKIIACCLVVTMIFSLGISASALGTSDVQPYYEEFDYVDSLGDTYRGVYTRNSASAVVTIYDRNGNLVSKAEQKNGSNLIVESIRGEGITRSDGMITRVINIHDLVIPTPANEVGGNVPALLSDTIPGSSSWRSNGYYNTDYLYLGNRLRGEGFYRNTGKYSEYDRVSYKFVQDTTISAIVLVISGFYSWMTAAKVTQVLRDLGVGMGTAAITMSWNFHGCVRALTFQFKCEMEYNGTDVVMSQIDRDLEYLYAYDDISGTESYIFDDYSYNSPTQAVNMRCSEVVGYGAKAFNVKYITQTNPSLRLPVSGPV